MVYGSAGSKSVKVNIVGSKIDILKIAWHYHFRGTSVQSHPHESRVCGGILLVVDIIVANIKGIHSVICKDFHCIVIERITAQPVI